MRFQGFKQAFLLCLFLTSLPAAVCAKAKHSKPKYSPPLQAHIILDAQSGEVFSEQNADQKTYPASLTKMMTLYLLFEALERKQIKLTTPMYVSALAVRQAPSKLGLRLGKTLRAQDAMLGLITKSANDAAIVVAEHLGGSVPEFVQLMNQKARTLGMTRTVFQNPSGLPNMSQITTARDMAILARALQKRFPTYYRYFRTRNFTYMGQIHKNHNRLLGVVPGVDGIKTGFICASGFNLAASAQRNGRRLIAVVMGGRNGPERDKTMRRLMDDTFASLGVPNNSLPAFDHSPSALDAIVAQANTPEEEAGLATQEPVAISEASLDEEVEAVAPTPLPVKAAQEPAAAIHQQMDALVAAHTQEEPKSGPTVTKLKEMLTKKGGGAGKAKKIRADIWVLQVGAFPQRKKAQQYLEAVRQKYQLTAGMVRIDTLKEPNKRKKKFVARIQGLSQADAQRICRHMTKDGMPCLVMRNIMPVSHKKKKK